MRFCPEAFGDTAAKCIDMLNDCFNKRDQKELKEVFHSFNLFCLHILATCELTQLELQCIEEVHDVVTDTYMTFLKCT